MCYSTPLPSSCRLAILSPYSHANVDVYSACEMACDSTSDSVCNPKSGSNLTWLWVTLGIIGGLVLLGVIAGGVYFVRHRYLHHSYDTL
jgi:hypothetical protein